jgi:hypothetical protein
MEEVIGLGQREIVQDGEFVPTAEEQALLDTNGVSASRLQQFADANGTMTINAALGGYATLLAQTPVEEVYEEVAAETVEVETASGEAVIENTAD